MELHALRARLCRVEPAFRLRTLAEAEAWVHERGVVEGTPCCSLASLHVAVHEPPYKPGSRGFGLYAATMWWWGGELATRERLHDLKIHHGKSVLVSDEVARLADPLARAALAEAETGAVGELERKLVLHLRDTGPGEVGDLRVELDAESKVFRAARMRLDVGPKSVVPSGPPWRLGVSKPPAPRRTADEAAR